MYFFYADESGSLDPAATGQRADGTTFTKDHLYVLAAVSLYERRWHGFEKTLNRKKRELCDVHRHTNPATVRLELADCEIKSTWTRIPKERAKRRFLANLTDGELTQLVELFYQQLARHNMNVFAVVVDKRYLHDYIDAGKMHRKAWELLLELVQKFLATEHPKHQGVLITDDISRDRNRSLAMKHAFFQSEGASKGTRLSQIAEMPLFVRSELSNGVQLADLVAYNIYRCFRDQNIDYPFFARMAPYLWVSQDTRTEFLDGLWVFPAESPLRQLPTRANRPPRFRPSCTTREPWLSKDSHSMIAGAAMNRSDGDKEAAGRSEKAGIRLTMYGIRASLTPGEIGESAPDSWAEVRTKVNRYLMRATVHVFGLLNDALDGTRRLIRGTCAIPSEAADRLAS
jgi:hypothetical protein